MASTEMVTAAALGGVLAHEQEIQDLRADLAELREQTEPKSAQQISQDEAWRALERLSGERITEDDIIFEGTQFVFPESIGTVKKAVRVLTERMQDEEEETSFVRTYPYRPWDGAHATMLAIRKAFGYATGRPIYSFFSKNPPQIIDIPVGINETVQVPWGNLEIPGLDGTIINTGTANDPELGLVYRLSVTGPKKWRRRINGFLEAVDRVLKENSIYKGKAIDGAPNPNFLDTSTVHPEDVVYSQTVIQQLHANVWSPIVHAQQLADLGQPPKRAVLFHGPYGTGKTLGAMLTAQIAEQHGWTFILCRAGKDDLMQMLQMAKMYSPAVLFYEDIDLLATADNGQLTATQVLEAFDGLQNKGQQTLLVVTTNHVEKLHRGMMRPGRLDAVIEIGAMDEPGVEKLIKRVIGNKLDPKVDTHQVFQAMEGFMPAFVKEAINRAVRYSVARTGGLGVIGTEDLVLAASGLRPQLNLMEQATDVGKTVTMDDLMRRATAQGLEGATAYGNNDTLTIRTVPQQIGTTDRLELTAGE